MASINDFQLTPEESLAFDAEHIKSIFRKNLATALKVVAEYESMADKYIKMLSVLNCHAEILSRAVGCFIVKAGNARGVSSSTRTTGNNATKSSSSGSSDPDPYPRRKNSLQQTRLTLARALNATTRLNGGAR